ncbi:MAG: 3-dehydroquinate synthase [Pseudomonadota bacterium]
MSKSTVRVDSGTHAYDIVIGGGLLPEAGARLSQVLASEKVCIVTDETVAGYYLADFTKALEEAGLDVCPPVILPAGEATKNFTCLQYIIDKCLGYGLDRMSALIALGGGVVGDITGLSAAIFMRGIGFVQVPTTLLSQVDSSVGGKTGINTSGGKNLVGAFHQPEIVLIDTDVLKTLPARELRAGYAEVLKYALVNDPVFFDWLELNGTALLKGDTGLRKHAIETSCRAKAAIVEQDEREEKDVRALLNMGHTFGHALEALGGYDGRLLHGEAVGIGSLLAYELSRDMNLCPPEDVGRVQEHLLKTGLIMEPPFRVTAEDMLNRMRGDKKNRDGRITLVLAKGIGKAFVARQIDETDLTAFLQKKFG